MKRRPRIPRLTSILLLLAAPLAAQVPKVATEQIDCMPKADNAAIHTTIAPEVAGAVPRLFFRWEEDEDFYWVGMIPEGDGVYWGVPPKPDPKNESVEYYVAVVDPKNQVLAKSSSKMAPVDDECEVELTEQQRGVAENLTVGETTFEQVGEEVAGFLCDGVVSRINPLGVLRGDERCRACVIAWWERKGIMIPLAAGLVGTGFLITGEEPGEASPTTP